MVPRLPQDESAGLADADAAAAAIGARAPVTVVAQSLVRERLGIEPDEIDSGHCPALSRPHEVAARLDAYRRVVGLQ